MVVIGDGLAEHRRPQFCNVRCRPGWDSQDRDAATSVVAVSVAPLKLVRPADDFELCEVGDRVHPIVDERPPRDTQQMGAAVGRVSFCGEQPAGRHLQALDPLRHLEAAVGRPGRFAAPMCVSSSDMAPTIVMNFGPTLVQLARLPRVAVLLVRRR
jgi:hypothetical protein